MVPSELPALLGELRALSSAYQSGDTKSFVAFRYLASKLLHLTILDSSSHLQLISGPTGPDDLILTSGRDAPLRLNDGRYLRLSILLYREETEEGFRLKVRESNFQYQLDPDGEHWIFRYDYIREPDEAIPAAHFQLRGSLLEEDCLPEGKPLHKIHFPTMRVSFEAVIRLLAVEFDVPCNENKEIWIPALETTESAFFDIQHLPVALAPSKTPRKKPRKK